MRYPALNFLACPHTGEALTCLATKETWSPVSHVKLAACARINQPHAIAGPVPDFRTEMPLTRALTAHACPPAPQTRAYEFHVDEGILVAENGRWYPIRNRIPELLPDHLRDFVGDLEFLHALRPVVPPAVFACLDTLKPFSERHVADAGIKHKRAEMSIREKIDNPNFFLPGYLSPFNPSAQEHSIYLLKMFALSLPLLRGPAVLDAGCGYAWTTEWLFKCGFEPLGMDITRVYVDIAVERLGAFLPHLAIADTEYPPVRPGAFDSVLCYDAFHHIPNRARALAGFHRALRPGGRVVLAEPGGAHEHDAHSKHVMDKYGILERGMELEDVHEYARGAPFRPAALHHFADLPHALVRLIGRLPGLHTVLKRRTIHTGNIFTLDR